MITKQKCLSSFLYRNKFNYLNKEIEKYSIYERFLKDEMKFSDDFKQDDKNVMAIIDRYKQLKRNQEEFMANFEEIENEKEAVNKEIVKITKQIAEENYTFSSQINDLKSYVEDMHIKVRNLKQGYEGDQGKRISNATDYAQIVIAIQNIHNFAIKILL